MTESVIELLSHRRSVPPRALREPGPSDAEIATLLRLAARVPDHGKLVPWRFILFRGDARARFGERLAALVAADEPAAGPERLDQERGRFTAPLVIGVVSRPVEHVKIPQWEQILSAGAACMNLVVAANALGYGVSWLTGWYAFDRRVFDLLGLAPHERMAGFVHIGSPALALEDRDRPDLAEIVSTWSGT